MLKESLAEMRGIFFVQSKQRTLVVFSIDNLSMELFFNARILLMESKFFSTFGAGCLEGGLSACFSLTFWCIVVIGLPKTGSPVFAYKDCG